jgi:hypothetical protein
MAEGRFAVVLKEQGVMWGPFATREEAGEFAEFVTAEIDPAEVRTLSSPVGELLAWRKAMEELNRD